MVVWLACCLGMTGSALVVLDGLRHQQVDVPDTQQGRDQLLTPPPASLAPPAITASLQAAGLGSDEGHKELVGALWLALSALFYALATVRLSAIGRARNFSALNMAAVSTCTLAGLSVVWLLCGEWQATAAPRRHAVHILVTKIRCEILHQCSR